MIEAEIVGRVGRVALARPEAHNALDQAAMAMLTAVLADWAARDDLRALVLTGRGRSFCAGAALGDVAAADWSDNPLTRLCDALEAFPTPTVAALNGGAYGGGVELALACDFRVGVTSMRAFVPPARLGIHYEPAGLRRAIDRLGSQATRRLFLLAETFDAEALVALGFLDHLVAPDALDAKVAELTDTPRLAGPPRGPRHEAHHPRAHPGPPRRGRRAATHRRLLRLRRPRRRPRRPARTPRATFHRTLNALPCKASDLASENFEIDPRSIKYLPLVSRAFYGRRLNGSDLARPHSRLSPG